MPQAVEAAILPEQVETSKSSTFGVSRVRMALLLGVLTLAAAYIGTWVWTAFVLAFMIVGFKELQGMMLAQGLHPSTKIVLGMGVLMALMATVGRPEILSPLLTVAIIGSFFRVLLLHHRVTIADVGSTLVSLFYIAYLPIHYILLRQLPDQSHLAGWAEPGFHYMLMTIFIISFSDIGAYYVGRKYGRHPLVPEISPKKTREGALGGLVVGMLMGVAYALIIGFPLHHVLILGFLLVIVGQLGDLTESMLKRDAGLKDSGGILKGHGGILDRTDSYIFSGAVCYYYIHWFVLNQGLAEDFLRQLDGWG